MSASDKSVVILEGAVVYGKFMNASGAEAAKSAKDRWEEWKHGHDTDCIHAARCLQTLAFSTALQEIDITKKVPKSLMYLVTTNAE